MAAINVLEREKQIKSFHSVSAQYNCCSC